MTSERDNLYRAPESGQNNHTPAPPGAPGCLGFLVAVLSFIPLIGVVFGIIAVIWGFIIRHTGLKIAGIAGIGFTVLLYGGLFYFGFVEKGGIYDNLRTQLAQQSLTLAVKNIEHYKQQHGQYPDSLLTLAQSPTTEDLSWTVDPTIMEQEHMGRLLYYLRIDENHYHIRAYGRDMLVGTADDVLPEPQQDSGLVTDFDAAAHPIEPQYL